MKQIEGGSEGGHLDIKALRLAVHGWRLGNPLVYKPCVADLFAVARELVSAGATSGTLIVSDGQCSDDVQRAAVATLLIVRTAAPGTVLGKAVALVVAEVTQTALGRECVIRGHWDVIIGDQPAPSLCHVSVEEDEGVALVGLRLTLTELWMAGAQGERPALPLLARPDWREVFLARILHALDNRLRSMHE